MVVCPVVWYWPVEMCCVHRDHTVVSVFVFWWSEIWNHSTNYAWFIPLSIRFESLFSTPSCILFETKGEVSASALSHEKRQGQNISRRSPNQCTFVSSQTISTVAGNTAYSFETCSFSGEATAPPEKYRLHSTSSRKTPFCGVFYNTKDRGW